MTPHGNLSIALPSVRVGWRIFWITFLVILALYVLVTQETLHALVSDLSTALVGTSVAFFLWFVIRNRLPEGSRLRQAWTWIALAETVYALGDWLWFLLSSIFHLDPFPSIADAAYLAYYGCILTAIYLLSPVTSGRKELRRMWPELLATIITAILIFVNLWIAPILQSQELGLDLGSLVVISYPILNLGLLFAVLAMLYNHLNSTNQPPLFLLTASMSVTFLADAMFYYQDSIGLTWIYDATNLVYILGNLFIFMAALLQVNSPPDDTSQEQFAATLLNRHHHWRLGLISIWLVGAFIVMIIGVQQPLWMSFPLLASGVALVFILILVRQVLLLDENYLLSRQLEVELAQRLKIENDLRQRTAELATTNLSLQSEIESRKQAEQMLTYRAYHDPLTGLHNRVYFLERLEEAIFSAKNNPRYYGAVLFLDLDRFKSINDSIGHEMGDHFLRNISRRLKDCLRQIDVAARFGGDEFAILLQDLQNRDDALPIAWRILDDLVNPITVKGVEFVISASIGIALVSPSYRYPEEVLRDADIAMYHAKAHGRSRCEVFDQAMYEEALSRVKMEADLRRALDRQELRVYFQPIVSLSSGTVTGFEALLRWQHPELGLISPGDFILLAEETRLIQPIGRWVLRMACLQVKAWIDQLGTPLAVSVNLSACQMQDPGLPLLVSDVLEDTHLSPALLTLEITEQSAVQDIRLSNNVMSELNDLGVRVAVDDFGSGYSSFYLLRELPLHTLKIDMSFVRGVPDSGRNDALLRSIVSLAHILDMDVTAEGVELQAQYDYLEAVHCDRVQGYLVSSPLPAEAVIDFLQQPVPAQRTTTSVPSFDATKALPVGTAGSLQR